MKGRVALLGALALLGCAPRARDGESGIASVRGVPSVRVALASGLTTVPISATGAATLTDGRGTIVARPRPEERWVIQRRGTELRAARGDGTATPWRPGAMTLVPARGEFVRLGGNRYRGSLRVVVGGEGLMAVNILSLENYLRGVVPLEIGARPQAERAAVQAQAIAARSFAVVRLAGNRARGGDFDLQSSDADQVYGGRDVEHAQTDEAIAATAGQVILYGGRAVSAPFHSTCGGVTAAAEEVWLSDGEPHLKRVSDKIPGSDRYYCDIAPRFYWTREITGSSLDASVARYLSAYVSVPLDGPGAVADVTVSGRTPSGRVNELRIWAVRGNYTIRGNDARSVLRTDAGERLPSAYFSVRTDQSPAGGIDRIVIQGNGYGHGVGMCQWGAIGRARVGQSARAILRTYYPGTTIGPIPSRLLTQ